MTTQPATFAAFVDRYRLRTKRDACGDHIVPGKFGHLYEHDQELFGLVLEDPVTGPSRVSGARGISERDHNLWGSLHGTFSPQVDV